MLYRLHTLGFSSKEAGCAICKRFVSGVLHARMRVLRNVSRFFLKQKFTKSGWLNNMGTEDIQIKTDVAIIGGGLSGLIAAISAGANNVDVAVIDKATPGWAGQVPKSGVNSIVCLRRCVFAGH